VNLAPNKTDKNVLSIRIYEENFPLMQ